MVSPISAGVYKIAESGGAVGRLAGWLPQWRGGSGAEGHSLGPPHCPFKGNMEASGLLTVPLKVTWKPRAS